MASDLQLITQFGLDIQSQQNWICKTCNQNHRHHLKITYSIFQNWLTRSATLQNFSGIHWFCQKKSCSWLNCIFSAGYFPHEKNFTNTCYPLKININSAIITCFGKIHQQPWKSGREQESLPKEMNLRKSLFWFCNEYKTKLSVKT